MLRRLLLALLVLAGMGGVCLQAQALTPAQRTIILGGGLGYTPPLDIVPNAAAAYGLRLLRKEYTGAAINCRRASDNAQKDIGFTRRGDLDTATLSSWLAGSTCLVTKWYDQSGHGNDASQATAASQPTLTLNVQNGRPSLVCGGSQFLETTNSLSVAAPMALYAIAERTGATTSTNLINQYAGIGPWIGFSNAANTAAFSGTSFTESASDNAWHSIIGVMNGSSSTLRVNGSSVGGTLTMSGSARLILCGDNAGNNLHGDLAEFVSWNSLLSSSQQAAIEANGRAYYGF